MANILIIEDEAELREALVEVLVDAGHTVRAVEQSELGLKLVIEQKPDLILLDVITRSLHASAFLERLRQLPEGQNDSKVIVLTNLDNDITRDKVAAFGIVKFLVKSDTSLETIVQVVNENLEFG